MSDEVAQDILALAGKLAGSRAANDVLRRKLEGSELRIRELEGAALEHEELRTAYMLKSERLTQALAILDAAGLLDKLPAVATPGERIAENDAKTPTATRDFSR